MRVAVTGSGGRLGRALVGAFADAPFTGLAGPTGWTRADYDLDDLAAPPGLIARDRPEVVVHAAAWTDVDGCARDPERARIRNGDATGTLARACVAAGVDLVVVSTNEVFDGARTDGRGYRSGDPTAPANPYGASKLAGELAAREAYASVSPGGPSLAIVRTAWLYGPPGSDFPDKIIRAAVRVRAAAEVLKVVGDEFGSPTSAADLAEAIVELVGSGEIGGIRHLRERRRGLAGGVGARGPPPDRSDGRRRGGSGVDLGPRFESASMGRPRVEPAAVGRVDAAVDRGAGRPRPVASPLGGIERGGDGGEPDHVTEPDRPIDQRAPSRLPGVRYGGLTRHADSRGSFRELWRASGYPPEGLSADLGGVAGGRFVQANLSTSSIGVLRGLHYHRHQLDRWIVASGRAFVALVDVRSAVAGTWPPLVETRELGPDETVEIPAGVAHGFLALDPLDLIYLVTNEFDASDELGFAWDDPAVAVPWPSPVPGTPDGRPILSERDRSNPSLRDLVAGLRR